MPVQLQDSGVAWSIPSITDAEFERFRRLIHDQTGICLGQHKRHLLVTRLVPVLHRLGLATFAEYYAHVAADRSGGELRALINRVTTNKTSFFREPHHFDFLRSRLIPELQRKGQTQLRIWSAGCSSGEEPYSLAITVLEALGKYHSWDVHILASDIDTDILAQAQSATYPMESLEDVTEARRRAWFLRGYGQFEGTAQVRPEVRALVEFRRINLSGTGWGIHTRFDAILCRNVIIYFDRAMQVRIVENLAGHLKPDGYFFSGHSENLFWLRGVLAAVAPTIYRLHPGTKNAIGTQEVRVASSDR